MFVITACSWSQTKLRRCCSCVTYTGLVIYISENYFVKSNWNYFCPTAQFALHQLISKVLWKWGIYSKIIKAKLRLNLKLSWGRDLPNISEDVVICALSVQQLVCFICSTLKRFRLFGSWSYSSERLMVAAVALGCRLTVGHQWLNALSLCRNAPWSSHELN